MKNIWAKLNKKVIITVAVVGLMVVALVASAFGWIKKEEVKVTAVQEVTKIQEVKKEENETKTVELRDPVKDYHELRKKLKKAKYKLNSADAGVETCNQFLNDFTENKNIEVIVPIIQTNNYDDEKLKPYFDRCPNLKKELNVAYFKDLVPFYAHYDYRLYDIDFDNNPDNEVHNVFFAAGFYMKPVYHKVKTNKDLHDRYEFVDFNNCKINGREGTFTIYDSNTLKPKNHLYNGIIKYKNKYYLYYTMDSNDKTPGLLSIRHWEGKEKSGKVANPYCRYIKENK